MRSVLYHRMYSSIAWLNSATVSKASPWYISVFRWPEGCCCKQEFQITNYLLVCSTTLVPDPPFLSKTRVCNSTPEKPGTGVGGDDGGGIIQG